MKMFVHSGSNERRVREGRRELVAEASADGNALATDGAAAAEHGSAGFGLHTCAEAVSFHALAAIRLKCALGHGIALLFSEENLCLSGKYLVYRRLGQESSGK
jgi:hypothetical protein